MVINVLKLLLQVYVQMNWYQRFYCTKIVIFHYGFILQMWPNPQETTDLVNLKCSGYG